MKKMVYFTVTAHWVDGDRSWIRSILNYASSIIYANAGGVELRTVLTAIIS